MRIDWRSESPSAGSANASLYASSVGAKKIDACELSTSPWLFSEVRMIHSSGTA